MSIYHVTDGRVTAVTNWLDERREVERHYDGGEYQCPHCHYPAVRHRSPSGLPDCDNPGCTAGCHDAETAAYLADRRAEAEAEEAEREKIRRIRERVADGTHGT